MDGTLAARSVVDVQGIDADQERALVAQVFRRRFGQVRMVLEVSVRAPVTIPARAHEHCLAADLARGERLPVDGATAGARHVDHHALAVGDPLERQVGKIVPVGKPMVRRVEVRARVADHLDAVDLELGSGRVDRARCLAREVVADQWRGQPLVRDHAALDHVAEIDSRDRLPDVRDRGFPALVRLLDDRLVHDAHALDHEQPELPDDPRGELVVRDVVAFDVEPEALALDAAAVAEIDLEVEAHPSLRRHPSSSSAALAAADDKRARAPVPAVAWHGPCNIRLEYRGAV